MKSLIIYSSLTGNTKKIAEAIAKEVEDAELLRVQDVEPSMLAHFDVIYIGYWVDKGDCDQASLKVMSHITNQRIVLFGTTGASSSSTAYYEMIKHKVETHIPQVHLLGHLLLQGSVSDKLIDRYRAQAKEHPEDEHLMQQIAAYEKGQSHPDEADIKEAIAFAHSIG